MRWRAAGLVIALALAAATRAQDDRPSRVHHWPHRVFSIPVDVAAIERGQNVPTHLQLYSSLAKGPWQPGPKKPLGSLDTLENGKKGFSFTADRDGEYEFSVQYHHKDYSSPKDAAELTAMLKVVIDTTLPAVRVNAIGNGVEWVATDDNLDPDGIRLQAKFPNWPEWKDAPVTRQLRTQDQFGWQLKPGQVLDVRVLARDRAGNESFSVPVQVPGNGNAGAFNTGFPRVGSDAPLTPNPGLPQPRIDYVRTPNFDVDYKIDRAGPSGIASVDLHVQKPRGGWELAQNYKLQKSAHSGDSLKLAYTAPEKDEGMYGFYVAPISGAGVKADPPGPNVPPMVYVTYDKTPPFLTITGVRVGTGLGKGPSVEIMWETFDQNPLADPISLEYSLDKNAVQWSEIRYRLPPGSERAGADQLRWYVGQFTWEVPDAKLWEFHVRARCVDKAGNSTTHVYKDKVVVDLEKPAASITGVRGSGDPPPQSTTPRPQPMPMPKVNPPMENIPAVPLPPITPPAVPELPPVPMGEPGAG